ncbi:ATP-binding protein [Deinococcus hopiensis]|uniref:DNA-binding transcriptional activator of the SARP family n=1 Tax=Deinococcus hopiensis KR-140 TaxID=695939 RepID=A0A1W1VXD8_9DEIO|nr:BTAD domain-containing putative transcriptional regulator [Deinococcus hopiensis]SMB97554.1 DNA-binding transcriptional activator of the SARP family [Deinococcus hopiensis KR-140]
MSAVWHAQVLGQVRLTGPGQVVVPLERKLAACLAYLALEGTTSRSRLVGLLWPDSPEATARNNLSQMLRKLRLATGADLIGGSDEVGLRPALAVDAAQARAALTQGRLADLLELDGTLLHHLSYDDCPDLDDWVTAQREQLQEWRTGALRAQLLRAERDGEVGEALALARRLLDLDPVSEEAWRHVMRLTYLSGDRPAALRAYRRCQQVLRREFGVDPLPETADLAREIDRGTVPAPRPSRSAALSLAVQRPPHLVGREREWAQMEAAWERGATYIYIRGAPGAGKTRLAQDFAASKGEFVVYEGRPGDTQVPFASSARNARTVLGRFPDVPLQEWVRREMARVLPELAREGEVLAPLSSESDVLRLRQAMQVFFAERNEGLAAVVADDWQFFDYESNQDGAFMWNTPLPQGMKGRLPPMLITYRKGEVAPESEALILRLIEAGQGILIDLEPLEGDGVGTLMDDLGVPDDPGVRARLHAHCGGNPLFLLETVRHLLETGQLAQGLPERLPLPPRVGQLIERRLALLSTPALQAARAAATLQRDFDVELVAQVLGAPLFDLMTAWEELGAAQIVTGERFSHDLVYEAVRQGVPASVQPLLHRGAARALEGQGAHPARIASHWKEGGKPALAAPQWVKAAEQAQARYLNPTAAQNLGQAGEAYWAAGEAEAAFGAWGQQGELLFYLEDLPSLEALAQTMCERARTPPQKALAYRIDSAAALMRGEVERGLETAGLGLACAVQAGDLRLEADLLEVLIFASYQQGFSPDPAAWLERMLTVGDALNAPALQAKTHDLWALYLSVSHPREALRHAEGGEVLYRTLGDVQGAAACAQKIAGMHLRFGDVHTAREALARMATYLERGTAMATQRLFLLESEAWCDYAQGRMAGALNALDQALRLEVMHGSVWTPEVRAWRATVLAELGASRDALAEARDLLRTLPDSPNQLPEVRVLVLDLIANLGHREEAEAALREAGRVLQGRGYWAARLDLARAALFGPQERLPLLEAVLGRSREEGFRGVALGAEVRRNAARLELGLPPLPWEAPPEDHPAGVIGLLEWREVRARVARILGPDRGTQALADLRAWVQQTAEHDVPTEYRARFEEWAQVAFRRSAADPVVLAHEAN